MQDTPRSGGAGLNDRESSVGAADISDQNAVIRAHVDLLSGSRFLRNRADLAEKASRHVEYKAAHRDLFRNPRM
jgi:hypothetical protein